MKEYTKRKQLILNGLTNVLDSGLDTPEKVVYLLVEIKKLRELLDEKLAALDLYRNWVVHTKLEHKGTTSNLIGKFDSLVKDEKSEEEIARDFIAKYPDFFRLENLKDGMKEFLATYGLPNGLTDDEACWKDFRKILLEILRECNIEPPNGKINKLSLHKDDKKEKCTFRFDLKDRVKKVKVKLKLD